MEFEASRLLRRLTSGVWTSFDFRKGPIPAAANDAASDLIDLVEAHLLTPRVEAGGLVASLMQREASGEWSREDVVASTIFLILAGQETIIEALNNAALALADHPRQRSALTRGEVSTESAAEELLRFDPPVPFSMLRIAADGAVLAGVPLERGESVVAVLASANHDDAVFPQGHELRLDRRFGPALSFGTGPHVCLGKHLALSEMRAALDALYRRMPHW